MNGENHWNQIRKKACSFAWFLFSDNLDHFYRDWGPCFPTIGIHKPIYIQFFNTIHFDNIIIRQTHHGNKVDLAIEAILYISESQQNEIIFPVDVLIITDD